MPKQNVKTQKAGAGSLHPVVRRSFETFQKLDSWREGQLTSKEPWCFNGGVGIWKYRITVEEIEEPKEVLEARLRKLWRECDNHHHWQPLQAVAKELGITLTHEERRAPNDQAHR
jgi:hypothetical protein